MGTVILAGYGPPFELNAANRKMNWITKRDLVYSELRRERDIQIANMHAKSFDKVWLLTYDDPTNAKRYVAELDANVEVLFRPRSIPPIAYGLLAPIIHRRHFRTANVCKTIELRGSITALLCKFLYGTRVVARQTYEVSEVIKAVQVAGGSPPFRSWIYWMLMVAYELATCHIADAVQVTSKAHRNRLIMKFRVSTRKIFVVRNWVDTSLFSPTPSTHKEKGRIVFVGRLTFVKNVFSLVEAMKGISEARLYMIGDGELRRPLQQKLHEEKVGNVVLFGTVPHKSLPTELNRSEIFVLPSFFDGSPRALIEAMACGLPVIASNTDEVREIAEDGITGLICDLDSDSIRKAITQLLSDSNLRAKLGSNARMHVEKNYTFQNVLENEIRIVNSVLKSGSFEGENHV